tara:strand:+ start:319 stop:918 length:600 start_codon:yes stop_codon:yes gene_type:complete
MWAMVKAGQVTAIYNRPKAITIDGIQHPAAIFTSWTKDQKKAIGIYDYSEVNASPDNRYYKQGTSETVVDDSAGTVVKTWTPAAKDLADKSETVDGETVVTLGVKSNEKDRVKNVAASLLQGSDWMAIRAAEGGTAVPSAVATYRAAVRTKSNSMETAIDDASDTAAMIALDTTTYHANGDINAVATLQDWPEVPEALK